MDKVLFFIGAMMLATPAHAGAMVPSPEAGAGLASLALLAGAYAFMRKRKSGN